MLNIVKTWLALKTDERAVTALEYGLIAALIACAIIVAVTSVGTNLSKQFTDIAKVLTY